MSWSKGLGSSLNELRIILCSTGLSSAGVREFVLKNHAAIREHNPMFSFMVRQREGADPFIIGQYAGGLEKKIFIGGLNPQQIQEKIQSLVKHT